MLQTFATVITAVGVLLAALALRASQRQRLRQFEAVYVERYWQLMDGLSLPAMKGEAEAEVGSGDEKVVLAYLRLCEDQCEMRSAGWIGDATWGIWKSGMVEQLGHPEKVGGGRVPVAAVWREQVESHPGQLTQLQTLTRGTYTGPTLVKRLLNGLYGGRGV